MVQTETRIASLKRVLLTMSVVVMFTVGPLPGRADLEAASAASPSAGSASALNDDDDFQMSKFLTMRVSDHGGKCSRAFILDEEGFRASLPQIVAHEWLWSKNADLKSLQDHITVSEHYMMLLAWTCTARNLFETAPNLDTCHLESYTSSTDVYGNPQERLLYSVPIRLSPTAATGRRRNPCRLDSSHQI